MSVVNEFFAPTIIDVPSYLTIVEIRAKVYLAICKFIYLFAFEMVMIWYGTNPFNTTKGPIKLFAIFMIDIPFNPCILISQHTRWLFHRHFGTWEYTIIIFERRFKLIHRWFSNRIVFLQPALGQVSFDITIFRYK